MLHKRGHRVGCGSGKELWDIMSDNAQRVIRQSDNGQKEEKNKKQNKRVYCPPPTKMG